MTPHMISVRELQELSKDADPITRVLTDLQTGCWITVVMEKQEVAHG